VDWKSLAAHPQEEPKREAGLVDRLINSMLMDPFWPKNKAKIKDRQSKIGRLCSINAKKPARLALTLFTCILSDIG
jgi:hypothetical protein